MANLIKGRVKGITTNTAFLRQLLALEAFRSGDYHTGTIASAQAMKQNGASPEVVDIAVAATVINAFRRDTRSARQRATRDQSSNPGWRHISWRTRGG